MSAQFDPSEFVDDDLQSARRSAQGVAAAAPALTTLAANAPDDGARAPTREEVDSRVGDMQNKLAELKRAQADLERERAALEETRRRQAEFATGRQEMAQHLTRGIGLLEESEFAARRDAGQMARTLVDLREALVKVQSVQEETWTKDNFNVELTRALTVIENARMEWNSARLKFSLLSGDGATDLAKPAAGENPVQELVRQKNYAELCKLGLALTWPLALVGLGLILTLVLRRT